MFAERVKAVVYNLFPQYDLNRSDTIDVNELPAFINAAFNALGYNLNIGQQEGLAAMAKIDRTGDRAANREELINTLLEMLMPGGVQIPQDFQPQH